MVGIVDDERKRRSELRSAYKGSLRSIAREIRKLLEAPGQIDINKWP